MKFVNVKINNKKFKARENETVLELAYRKGIMIPHLCYHPDTKVKANCRVCTVEVKGESRLLTSCSTKVCEGMEIMTNSDKVERARRINLEFIFAEHIEKCPTCPIRLNCQLLKYAKEYKIKITKFSDRKKKRKIYKFGPAIELDGTQCIDCRNCIEVCNRQGVGFLKLKNKGYKIEVAPVNDKKHDCVYCGQCAVHCPVTASQEQLHYSFVDNLLKNKKGKILIAQINSSVISSLGESLKLPNDSFNPGQLRRALRELGFDYIINTDFGVDISVIEQAEELLEKINNKKQSNNFPLFNSSCPSFVRFIELYYPELIKNISSVDSPQIKLGKIIKTYWANKMKINSKDIIIVSLTPCTAEKFEITQSKFNIKNKPLIDYALTVRELGYLLHKSKIELNKLKPLKIDKFLKEYSSVGSYYGLNGGTINSVIQTAKIILKEKKIKKINFKPSNLNLVQVANVSVGGKKLSLAIANTLEGAKNILEDKINQFDYVEFRACPDGCVGGGGQPIPTTLFQRNARKVVLQKVNYNNKLRQSGENKTAKRVLAWCKNNKK